jgi:hypothetical protein
MSETPMEWAARLKAEDDAKAAKYGYPASKGPKVPDVFYQEPGPVDDWDPTQELYSEYFGDSEEGDWEDNAY